MAALICMGLGFGVAIWLAWADFRTRMVPVIGLVLFGLSGLGYQITQNGWSILTELALSLALVLLLWASLWMIYKRDRFVWMDVVLGWGDVWMLGGLACWFPPSPFVLFLCVVFTFATLIYGGGLLLGRISAEFPVPLAGVLALGFLLAFPLYRWGITAGWLWPWLP